MIWLLLSVLVLVAAFGGCIVRVARATEDSDDFLPDLENFQEVRPGSL